MPPAPGPERRAKRSRANTLAQLLDGAYGVFAEIGFARATVEDICEGAGFSRGAFYSNFSTKEELLFALWSRQADLLVQRFRELAERLRHERHDVDVAQLALLFEALQDIGIGDRRWYLVNTEFTLHALRNPLVAEELVARRAELRRELGAVVRAYLDLRRRELPLELDERTFVRLLLAFYEGAQAQVLLEPDAEEGGEGRAEALVLRLLLDRLTTSPLVGSGA